MSSHLKTIIDRLEKLIAENDSKATYNFEREGLILATVSFDAEENVFNIKYPKQKTPVQFDNLDLIAIEIYDLIYD